jgi:hypothetical protein
MGDEVHPYLQPLPASPWKGEEKDGSPWEGEKQDGSPMKRGRTRPGKETSMPAVRPSIRQQTKSARATLARKYLYGSGIEIGALSNPVPVQQAEVSYYDRCSELELAELYPHRSNWLVPLAGITELESLACIEDNSQNFVIACKVLEYTSNVLAAFHTMHRVLQPGGIAYLSITDKRHTSDSHRPVTTIGQLAADYVHGPRAIWSVYHEEWAHFVEYGLGHDRDERLHMVVQHAQRTRQHVWTPVAWMELLAELQRGLGFELQTWHVTSREILTVLRKAL